MKWTLFAFTLSLVACASAPATNPWVAESVAEQKAIANVQQQLCGNSEIECARAMRTDVVVSGKIEAQYFPKMAAFYAATTAATLAGFDESTACSTEVLYAHHSSQGLLDDDELDDDDTYTDDEYGDITVLGPPVIARLKADEDWVREHRLQIQAEYKGIDPKITEEAIAEDEKDIAKLRGEEQDCVSAKRKLSYAQADLQYQQQQSEEHRLQQERRQAAIGAILNQIANMAQQQAEIESRNAEEQSESFTQDQQLGREQQQEFEQQQENFAHDQASQQQADQQERQMEDFLYSCYAQLSAPAGCHTPGALGSVDWTKVPTSPPPGYTPGIKYTKPPAVTTQPPPPATRF